MSMGKSVPILIFLFLNNAMNLEKKGIAGNDILWQ
jgi:hypothetical protein